jgi:hypothetical protein
MSICGFCRLHRFNMTYREALAKGCFDQKKQRGKGICKHFNKIVHPIWEQKARNRKKKKYFQAIKKEKLNKIFELNT